MELNAVYEGDNLEVMSKFDSKSIDLIYADPPFFTNKQFEIIWHDGAEKREEKHNTKAISLESALIISCSIQRVKTRNSTRNSYRFQNQIEVTKSMLRSSLDLLMKKAENIELQICLVLLHVQT